MNENEPVERMRQYPSCPGCGAREEIIRRTFDERLRAVKLHLEEGFSVELVARNWPVWFDPEPLEFSGPAVGPFARCAPLTRDGSVFAVETAGCMSGPVCFRAPGRIYSCF